MNRRDRFGGGSRRSASQRTPQAPDALASELQRVWRELALSLAPSIRVVGHLDEELLSVDGRAHAGA